MTPPATSRDVRWAPERFYWGVLDSRAIPRRLFGHSDEQLGYLLESYLPSVAIEDVHAVYCRIPGTSDYLACAVRRSILAEVNGHSVTLGPSRLPPFVERTVDPATINLLTGDFEPRRVRRLSRVLRASLVVILVLAVVAIVWGMEQRRATALDARTAVIAAQHDAYVEGLGDRAQLDNRSLPLERQLTAAVRELTRTRQSAPAATAPIDCTLLLEHVLAAWPPRSALQTSLLTVSGELITVHADAPTLGQAHDLTAALGTIDEWRVHDPAYDTHGSNVQVTFQLVPIPNSEEATP